MTVLSLPIAQTQSLLSLLGGKAANINRLLAAGFTVPASIVISTEAYWAFVTANKLETFFPLWTSSPVSDEVVLRHFLEARMPPRLADLILNAYQHVGGDLIAVRSSGIAEDWEDASFAGQQDTFLNVRGETAVLEAVKKCWASLWMSRAVAYRRQNNVEPQVARMAVLLQPMIAATCAGVLFTQDPVRSIPENIIIEAVHGLGDKLVSGQVTPDRYSVNRHSKAVEAVPVHKEPVLTNSQIARLVDTGLAIADLFGTAQDIEWAIAGDKLYILQSRAITTQAAQQEPAPLPPDEINVPGDDAWLPEEKVSHPFDLWTRANFGEVLPYPVTPLTLSSLQKIGDAAELQLSSGEKVQMARRIYGRIYANEGGMRQFVADLGLPTSFIDTTWGSRRPDLPPKAGFRPGRLLLKGPQLVWRNMKSQQKASPQEPILPKDEADLFQQIDIWADEFQKSDLSGMNQEEIWYVIQHQWEPRRAQVYKRHLAISSGAFFSFAPLEWMAKKWGHDARLAQALVTGLTAVYAAKMGPALQRIAQDLLDANLIDLVLENSPQAAWDKLQVLPEAASVRQSLEQFLQEHGHRCPAEPEISLPRWAEAPEQVVVLVRGYVTGKPVKAPAQEQSLAESAQQTIEKQIGPLRRSLFRQMLHRAKQQVRRRDNSRHFMAKVELCRRQLFMTLGHRWQEQGVLHAAEDIFFLTHDEIDLAMKGGKPALTESFAACVAARRLAHEFWSSYSVPEVLDFTGRPLPNSVPVVKNGLQGVPASGGIVTGPVRIIRQPSEVVRIQPGDILVTLATDPGWTPVFPLVAGLILVYGGQLSHGAIVAREYGVPAVVNVPEAMSQLHEGMIVTVDGSEGHISW